MAYPLRDLCVVVDPTEAVHSELIVEMLHGYFRVAEVVPVGGALAYPLLTHNAQLFATNVDPDQRELWGQFVLDRDAEFLASNPDSTLFAYFAAQPEKEMLSNPATLIAWEKEEELREERAVENGQQYCDRSLLGALYWELSCLQTANRELQQELTTIRTSFLLFTPDETSRPSVVRGVLQSSLVRRLRGRTASPS